MSEIQTLVGVADGWVIVLHGRQSEHAAREHARRELEIQAQRIEHALANYDRWPISAWCDSTQVLLREPQDAGSS